MSYRLNVPYTQKERVKPYGARWNATDKIWFYPGDDLPRELVAYLADDEIDRYEANRNGRGGQQDNVPDLVEIGAQNFGQIEMNLNAIDQNAIGEMMDPVIRQDQQVGQAQFNPEATGNIIVVGNNEQINTDDYMSVSDLNYMISDTLQTINVFQSVMVKGEVTNYNGAPNNGNYYFTIKDNRCQIPCFMSAFYARNMNFTLTHGQQVAIIGSIGLYEKSGKSQLVVNRIYNIGEGAMNLAYLQLKERLRAEGLFDQEHKKPIPKHSKRIGIVTSAEGQAIQDIQDVMSRRNPYVKLILYHVNVQGVNAARTIVNGINFLDNYNVDVIIVGRGGGSTEELIAFNDEGVARAIYNAQTPIVSAVGHAGNFSLADEVVDHRFITPTDAAKETSADVMTDLKHVDEIFAEMKRIMLNNLNQRMLQLNTVQAKMEQKNPKIRITENMVQLENMQAHMKKNMDNILQRDFHKLEILSAQIEQNKPEARIKQQKMHLEKLQEMMKQNMMNVYHRKSHSLEIADARLKQNHPGGKVRDRQNQLERISENMQQNMQRTYQKKLASFDTLVATLHGLSPTAKLVNGFGYVQSNGKPVTSIEEIKPADKIQITISDGNIEAVVEQVSKSRVE